MFFNNHNNHAHTGWGGGRIEGGHLMYPLKTIERNDKDAIKQMTYETVENQVM
jgi:hypothetical protein